MTILGMVAIATIGILIAIWMILKYKGEIDLWANFRRGVLRIRKSKVE